MQRDRMINIPSVEKKNVWKETIDFPGGRVVLEIFAVQPSGGREGTITSVPIKTFTFSRRSTIACFWTPELFPIKGGFWPEKFEKMASRGGINTCARIENYFPFSNRIYWAELYWRSDRIRIIGMSVFSTKHFRIFFSGICRSTIYCRVNSTDTFRC